MVTRCRMAIVHIDLARNHGLQSVLESVDHQVGSVVDDKD